MKLKHNFKVGDTVEYKCVAGIIRPQILEVRGGGKLLLNTRKTHKLIRVKRIKGWTRCGTVTLIKNVSVWSHRVKLIKQIK